jgi:hypothetical protein
MILTRIYTFDKAVQMLRQRPTRDHIKYDQRSSLLTDCGRMRQPAKLTQRKLRAFQKELHNVDQSNRLLGAKEICSSTMFQDSISPLSVQSWKHWGNAGSFWILGVGKSLLECQYYIFHVVSRNMTMRAIVHTPTQTTQERKMRIEYVASTRL